MKRSYPFFCPRVELCWKARLTRTSGMALHFEILVVATLFISTQLRLFQNATPCHLSVSAWLSNTTQLLGKRRSMNASLFVNIVKKTRRTYHRTHFRTKRMGSLKTLEKNAGKWQSNRFLQNDAFFGVQGPSIQAKFILRKRWKSNIRAKYTSLQNVGVLQRAG